MGMHEVDVYPVGLLDTLIAFRFMWRHRGRRGAIRGLWIRLGYLRRQLRARNWRAVRSYFNGFLAEPQVHDWTWTRCGHGWTQARALRDLHRHMDELRDLTPSERWNR